MSVMREDLIDLYEMWHDKVTSDARLDRLCVIAAGVAQITAYLANTETTDGFALKVAEYSRAILAKLEEE